MHLQNKVYLQIVACEEGWNYVCLYSKDWGLVIWNQPEI
jgi:hypothetical protein